MNPSILGRALARLAAAFRRQREIHRLSSLDDYILRDIGVDRSEIAETVERGLPFRNPTAIPRASRAAGL